MLFAIGLGLKIFQLPIAGEGSNFQMYTKKIYFASNNKPTALRTIEGQV